MLGAEVPVATPTGSVKLRIRPNTQNGQEIHVRGRGLPKRGGGKGDLIVQHEGRAAEAGRGGPRRARPRSLAATPAGSPPDGTMH